MVELYTLPTCGICNMIKTKLNQKNIPYEEKDFSIFAEKYNTDRAPAMIVDGLEPMTSPSSMVNWINAQ